jgi:integrase
VAYVIERTDRHGRPRYTGIYWAVDGKAKSAGTFDTHERAYEVAAAEELQVRRQTEETTPAQKATMTIRQFGEDRFLEAHHAGPGTKQNYAYALKNHVYPYIGHMRISEISREIFRNLLITILPGEEASPVSVRVARNVLSGMCQLAMDEGYRDDNPVRTIRLPAVGLKPILVANYQQWDHFEGALRGFGPAQLYARVNVMTWARRCEMISLRPSDFDFAAQMVTISRSTVYVTSKFHPSGKAGWITKNHPKNGDWRRFTVSKQLCVSLQEHIEEHGIADDEVLFPQWMFAYRRPEYELAGSDEPEKLPPVVTKGGKIHEHGTFGAIYAAHCNCFHCRRFNAEYQREWRHKQTADKAAKGALLKAHIWRRDGTEFLKPDVWGRFWDWAREKAGLPEDFTPYNARHTGISWAIAKGVDLQKVRQRAGHGSLDVTSRYAAILDEQDMSVADSFEEIFSQFIA